MSSLEDELPALRTFVTLLPRTQYLVPGKHTYISELILSLDSHKKPVRYIILFSIVLISLS